MKKTLLSVAAIALFATTVVSCQNENKGTEGADSTKIEASDSGSTTAATEAPAKPVAAADVPTFSSEEVNKSLAEFNTLKDQYVVALKSKNATEIKALGVKYATWAQTSATFVSKLKADEVQKYTDYMTKVSKEWSEAAMTAAQ